MADYELSEEEGGTQNKLAYSGQFRPNFFQPLLIKAKNTANMGVAGGLMGDPSEPRDPRTSDNTGGDSIANFFSGCNPAAMESTRVHSSS